MKHFLILCVSVATFLCLAGTPAWAKASGNFHFKGGGAVGCHWATAARYTSGRIRCERYSDHTYVAMTRKGRIIVKKHYRGWVAPGTNGQYPEVIGRRIMCTVLSWGTISGGLTYDLTCGFYLAHSRTALRSFEIGETGPITIKHS